MRAKQSFLPLLTLLFFSLFSCAESGDGQKAEQQAEEPTRTQEASMAERKVPMGSDKAYFAGGCFWCTEAVYERLKGVSGAVSGYAGGKEQKPTYAQVSRGETGHAEAIEVTYDPKQISYEQLVEVLYLAAHDPTQLNRQGPDVGEQYRSAIFYTNEKEKETAEKLKTKYEMEGKVDGKIVTQIVPFTKFWEAEAYHQDYYPANQDNPYIRSVSKPKVDKFMKKYHDWLKPQYQ